MAEGDILVEKTIYGCLIVDTPVREMVGVNLEDIPQLIKDLTALLPEPEMNYNTVVMSAGDGLITHTYSPECPEGCKGQMDGCAYKPEVVRHHINDAFNGGRHDEPMFKKE